MVKNELYVLLFATLFILGLLFALLFYLVIRKAFGIRKRSRIELKIKDFENQIFTFLREGKYNGKFKPETNIDKMAVEELLSKYAELLEGEEEKANLTSLAEHYLTDYYRNRLKSGRWSIRMNALFHIEDFKMGSLLRDIFEMLNKKRISQDEIIHVLRILATMQSDKINGLLTNRFINLSEYEYRNILIRLDGKGFDLFVLGFHKSQRELQYAILDVMGVKKELSYLSFVENIFSSYSGEIKLRALKTLGEIGYVTNIDPYLPLCSSGKWEERMMAAKLIGVIKEKKGLQSLVDLLHDQTWWVRSQAGQSIMQFPNGREILQGVWDSSSDIFAKDMAWEWMHKGV